MLLIVLVALNLVGVIACGVGSLVTTPISTLATVKAYEQLTRPSILPEVVAPPPVDPMPPAS